MELILYLAERISIVILIVFILSRMEIFKKIINRDMNKYDKLFMIIFFSVIGIVGSYSGIEINGALLNSRAVGVIVSGLLGGPVVGIATGIIVGIHRYTMGGFTALACALSTILEGIIGGFLYHYKGRNLNWKDAALAGFIGELMQMVIILSIARPFVHSWELIHAIAIPMIFVNTSAISVFTSIIQFIHEEQEYQAAMQSRRALNIADRTLPYLRQGLNEYTARETCKIIREITGVSAVSITNTERILAFEGVGCDHHKSGEPLATNIATNALKTGNITIGTTRKKISCVDHNCPLGSVVIVPLFKNDKVMGLLKIYKVKEYDITRLDEELLKSLGKLFSTQLELNEIERQEKLAKDAEIKALQAQINPHFLFNTISTISSLIRTNPDVARKLLLRLSNFFRYNIQKTDKLITLKEELSHIEDYIEIEKARHGDKLNICIDIDEKCLSSFVPPLTLQPLIENAIKHGIKPKHGGGTIKLNIKDRGEYSLISVIDDGVGMTEEALANIKRGSSCGIGLKNVIDRIASVYGDEYTPVVESEKDMGTSITFKIPPFSGGEAA